MGVVCRLNDTAADSGVAGEAAQQSGGIGSVSADSGTDGIRVVAGSGEGGRFAGHVGAGKKQHAA